MADFDFKEFKKKFYTSGEEICKEIYLKNQGSIQIKNEKRAIENLERIFNAVFTLSSKKGFQAMTMRDLSKEASMSMGGLYAYFKNKNDLLAIIHIQGSTMLKNVLERFEEYGNEPFEKLKFVIKAHIYLSEIARAWFFFSFMEARNLSPSELKEVQELESYTEKVLVDILINGEKKGAFKRKNHFLTASIIKAMQQDWYLKRWKYRKRGISPDNFCDYVIEFVKSFTLA
ncbi:MAG: TetR family transcriptional regulator [Deltaproteobacteria bacterium]|nr:MAG: TetR family transcriptional regulator [Deltaproteobacteria bacterium]